jgi:sugar lactone lactonase YvrE
VSGTTEPELVLDARAGLGEGPSWDAVSERLLWVDIFACEVHRYDPASGRDEVFAVERPVGAAVPRAGGGIVVCRQGGVVALDPATGVLEELVAIEADRPQMMLNDAKCDAAGRLFAGTLDIDETPEQGSLYRIEADLGLTRLFDGVTCSNGIGWSPGGETMYYVDSTPRRVDVLDYDAATGAASNRRTFVQLEGVPQPDGLCVDAEGCVWVAFWDGWCLRRYRPDGTVDRVVELPVQRVTSCCFGGPDLTDLYVTTASPDEPDPAQPNAGGLFLLRPGVSGLPTHRFAG